MPKKRKNLKESKMNPEWEVIVLVSNHLCPKTLSLAACVSKLWHLCMSSDHLWQPILASTYPSLSSLRLADPAVPYRRLYALGHASDKRRVQNQQPQPPVISLSDVIFSVTVFHRDSPLLSLVKPGRELGMHENGVFLFDLEPTGDERRLALVGGNRLPHDVRVTWEAVLEGYTCKFTMLECGGEKRSFVSGMEAWYSEELPSPGCCPCSKGTVSGLVADLRLGWKKESCGRVLVEKISLGVMSVAEWRYVQVVDVLRYLQHFLLK
ncbi:unnamed protein product [Cuscuta europaea]|uniref:F-box protein n=1 Tax=Cuscuta europaea TaxID=41803 RepID=A0A9P0YY10_CUSEU|nr:unnamed protein product [Cuscuta europaea]